MVGCVDLINGIYIKDTRKKAILFSSYEKGTMSNAVEIYQRSFHFQCA